MKIIAVDFDGCLCESKWPEIGEPIWPVIHELQRRQAEGDAVILWTCREGEKLAEAVMWSLNHGLRFDAVNANLQERIDRYGCDSRKVSADEYWDDRASALICMCGKWARVFARDDHGLMVQDLTTGKVEYPAENPKPEKTGLIGKLRERIRKRGGQRRCGT